jgi:hypothetical protein
MTIEATLEDCLRMRKYYSPNVEIQGGLECISYPFPTDKGGLGIMVRTKDDPTTIREVGIPESDWIGGDYHGQRYPHGVSCMECRELDLCNYCSTGTPQSTRCTNGRCPSCCRRQCNHAKWGSAGFNAAHQFDHQSPCFERSPFPACSCSNCGSTAEQVEIMALVAGIENAMCCDDSQWDGAR